MRFTKLSNEGRRDMTLSEIIIHLGFNPNDFAEEVQVLNDKQWVDISADNYCDGASEMVAHIMVTEEGEKHFFFQGSLMEQTGYHKIVCKWTSEKVLGKDGKWQKIQTFPWWRW